MLRVFSLAIALLLLASACGRPGPKTYSASKTRACMVGKHLRVGRPPASDFVANTALGGAFRVHLHGNAVTMAFGDTVTNGEKLDAVYRSVRGKNVGIDDVLRSDGNAVMLWQEHPTDAQLGLIQGCLET